jgi:hypothetical protein
LIDEWLNRTDLPLLLRLKKGNRGEPTQHETGRMLVCTDNAPANWALSCAILGRTPTVAELQEGLENGRVPIALALSASERAVARFKGIQRPKMDPPNLNTLGWKVCHIVDIGLNQRCLISTISLQRLVNHFRLFLNPRNMFVAPKEVGGLAESSVFQAIFREGDWFDKLTE